MRKLVRAGGTCAARNRSCRTLCLLLHTAPVCATWCVQTCIQPALGWAQLLHCKPCALAFGLTLATNFRTTADRSFADSRLNLSPTHKIIHLSPQTRPALPIASAHSLTELNRCCTRHCFTIPAARRADLHCSCAGCRAPYSGLSTSVSILLSIAASSKVPASHARTQSIAMVEVVGLPFARGEPRICEQECLSLCADSCVHIADQLCLI